MEIERRLALLIALLAASVFCLHDPGQVSIDAIIQLQDGLSRVYDSNQPPAMSWLLAHLTFPGLLLLEVLLFALAVAVLTGMSEAGSPARYWVTATLFLFPVCLLYLGTLWKDVLFAHAALLGLLLLHPARNGRWRFLLGSAMLLALGTSVRQQGLVLVLLLVPYFFIVPGHAARSWLARLKAGLLWVAIYAACSTGIALAVHSSGDVSQSKAVIGPMWQLALFDLGGIAARQPELRFPALETLGSTIPSEHRPTREQLARVLAAYRPDRQDHMGTVLAETGIWLPPGALIADWRMNLFEYPLDYLRHRLDAAGWIFGLHEIPRCLPYYVGIAAEPSDMVREIGVMPGISARAALLGRIGDWTQFLFRPAIYLGLSLMVIGRLVYWNWRRHAPMILIQIAGLGYAASYLVLGIACDFRYTYFSALAALFGAAYLLLAALEPMRRDNASSAPVTAVQDT